MINVRLAVTPFIFTQYKKVFDPSPKATPSVIFGASLGYVARHHAKKGIENGNVNDQRNGNGTQKQIDSRQRNRKNQHRIPQGIRTVSAVQKALKAFPKSHAGTVWSIFHYTPHSFQFTYQDNITKR